MVSMVPENRHGCGLFGMVGLEDQEDSMFWMTGRNREEDGGVGQN